MERTEATGASTLNKVTKLEGPKDRERERGNIFYHKEEEKTTATLEFHSKTTYAIKMFVSHPNSAPPNEQRKEEGKKKKRRKLIDGTGRERQVRGCN